MKIPPHARTPMDLGPAFEAGSPSNGVEEVTRHWRPTKAQTAALMSSGSRRSQSATAETNEFRLAARERTVIEAPNLRDPRLMRSDRPQPIEAPSSEADEIEFVGAAAEHAEVEGGAPEASQEISREWAPNDEQTTIYRPQRTYLAPEEEATDEFEVEPNLGAEGPGPRTPKVIVSAAVLAGRVADASTAEPTLKSRARQRKMVRFGLVVCALGLTSLMAVLVVPRVKSTVPGQWLTTRLARAVRDLDPPPVVPVVQPRPIR